MIIYNETINIDDAIHQEWREWMQEYIPQVLATGLFSKLVFSKVLITEEMGGTTILFNTTLIPKPLLKPTMSSMPKKSSPKA